MEITLEQARKAMKELVESKPEGFGYKDVHKGWLPDEGCRYVINGEPACIVGQVAFLLGVSTYTLESNEGAHAGNLMQFSEGARQYLLEAQTVQDKGFTWALAHQAAEMLLILGTRFSNGEWDR